MEIFGMAFLSICPDLCTISLDYLRYTVQNIAIVLWIYVEVFFGLGIINDCFYTVLLAEKHYLESGFHQKLLYQKTLSLAYILDIGLFLASMLVAYISTHNPLLFGRYFSCFLVPIQNCLVEK